MPEDILLKINDLGVSFKTEDGIRRAVNSVSFVVRKGKTTAVVGESGSGKSVSSLSIMQLLRKGIVQFDHGDFTLFPLLTEQETTVAPTAELLTKLRGHSIAMIFQEPMTSLNPVLTCGEQLMESLIQHLKLSKKEARQKAVELFEEVKLPRAAEMIDQYPHQLSGGQRQRVMIAMAISCKPKLLIADEPTTALDVTVQHTILQLLRELQVKYDMAMIFITHDLGIVKDIADEIVVMRHGEVMESGIAHDILNAPQHPYTQGLLACRAVPGKKLERMLTLDDVEKGITSMPEVESSISADASTLIEINHLFKTYEKKNIFGKTTSTVNAVNDVSFIIREGETIGLVGESGCGKTTLSRMLLGLIPSTNGEIKYQGVDLAKETMTDWRKWRKDLQIIFQDPYSALNPKHTVGEALMEPLIVYGLFENDKKRKQRVIELLEKVGMPSSAFDRYPHEFSGGQRQRIVIARALAVEPKFIICDESVAALDVSVQAQVLNLLNDLKRDFKLTYLFISHDLSVVYQMSDRIMVMNKGKIEEIGEAKQVFHNPKSEYTKSLLASIPGR
jgi:peptide/nickel transport system ATP-binding protein